VSNTAVHCKTEDEWKRTKSSDPKFKEVCGWDDAQSYGDVCIYLDGRGFDRKIDCLKRGFHIISAQEYLGGEEMTETERKFGDRYPRGPAICKECYQPYGKHIGSECRQETTNNIKGEDKMEISNNIFEVFNKEDMKKVQTRFGTQYGDTDRDFLALRHDKDSLLKIIKEEEAAAKKEALEKD
jgi:hypothetical protein